MYWHKFKEPDKRRPVVILTRNRIIPALANVTVASITTTIRPSPTQVLLTEEDGLHTDCAINLDNINTIPKNKLESFITHLPHERMSEIRDAINFAFGFDALD